MILNHLGSFICQAHIEHLLYTACQYCSGTRTQPPDPAPPRADLLRGRGCFQVSRPEDVLLLIKDSEGGDRWSHEWVSQETLLPKAGQGRLPGARLTA